MEARTDKAIVSTFGIDTGFSGQLFMGLKNWLHIVEELKTVGMECPETDIEVEVKESTTKYVITKGAKMPVILDGRPDWLDVIINDENQWAKPLLGAEGLSKLGANIKVEQNQLGRISQRCWFDRCSAWVQFSNTGKMMRADLLGDVLRFKRWGNLKWQCKQSVQVNSAELDERSEEELLQDVAVIHGRLGFCGKKRLLQEVCLLWSHMKRARIERLVSIAYEKGLMNRSYRAGFRIKQGSFYAEDLEG